MTEFILCVEQLPVMYKLWKSNSEWESERVIAVDGKGIPRIDHLVGEVTGQSYFPQRIRWSIPTFEYKESVVFWKPIGEIPTPRTFYKPDDINSYTKIKSMRELEKMKEDYEDLELFDPNTQATRENFDTRMYFHPFNK